MSVIDIDRPDIVHGGPATEPVATPTAPAPTAVTQTAVTQTAVTQTAATQTAAAPTTIDRPAAPRPPRRRLFADLGGALSRSWGLALALAWVVVVAVGIAVEPAPVDPDAPVPLIADLLSTALMATWGAMAAGIVQRRRFTAAASLAGGLGLLALAIGCPASGHHAGIGAWWGVQIVGSLALVALSARALRSS